MNKSYLDLGFTDREINDIKALAEDLGSKSSFFETMMSKNYRNSSYYEKYEKICLAIASHLETLDTSAQLGILFNDTTYINCTHSFFGLFHHINSTNVYAISEELFQDFVHSDAPKQLWGIERPFERAVIALPKNKLINPDGMPVNWIVLDFLTHEALTYLNPIYAAFLSEQTNGAFDAGRMEDAQFLTDDLNCDRLRWTTVLDYSFHYSSTKAIPRHGEEDPYTILDDFAVGDAEVEKQFTNKVTAIVVFFLLFLTSARGQDSLSVPSATGFGTNKPKGKKRDDKNKFRTYIQVGKDYKRHRVNRGGTHASPVGHPRRGHVRTIVKKSDINDFSEVWVRPCWVGGNGK